MTPRVEKNNHPKKPKWLKYLLIILLIILLLGSGMTYYMWHKFNTTLESTHQPLTVENDAHLNSLLKNKQTINLLLLGIDEAKNDQGRTDTMILLSLNPKTNTMMMISIPRDTRVPIANHGLDKINHANVYGGVPLTVSTVEQTLDIPVHFYALINMEGFIDGIDEIGGITVYNPQSFTQDGILFNEGDIHLDGNEALSYIRMRKEDKRGDLGRNKRQRDIIKATINEVATFSNVTRLGTIVDILGNNVETNLQMDHLQKLFLNYRHTRKNIVSPEIQGTGQVIGGVWYYIVSDEEFHHLSNDIKTHMYENNE